MLRYISTWPEIASLPSFPRKLSILGSTGSIGTSALKIVAMHPEKFQVIALTGGQNIKVLAQQATHFRPKFLAVLHEQAAATLRSLLPANYTPNIVSGAKGYQELAALPEVDTVLSAIVGAAGFLPTLAAVQAGKLVALANKESLVIGGSFIRKACKQSQAVILPVDSEHNALFQALSGHSNQHIHKLILTASGGPFRGKDKQFLSQVTREQALNHPNWSMGAKISVDSATLMNKGLEIIEACHLYGLPVDRVEVVVHPQSIVHSLVEYKDGSQIAHLGVPNMRIPIAHCLCYPERVETGLEKLSLAQTQTLSFEQPDMETFPCLGLAKEAYAAGISYPIVLNACNEVAVDLFLNKQLHFMDIPNMLQTMLEQHQAEDISSPEVALNLDAHSRSKALAWAKQKGIYG